MQHVVEVAGRRLKVELPDGVRIGRANVASREVEFDAAADDNGRTISLILDGRSFEATLVQGSSGARILIDGESFEIRVIDERRERARALAGGDAVRSQSGELHAPMPGLVVKMLASTGDRVDKGAGLVVVEAMKMENEFRSPVAGIVREVRVQPGQTVEKGELLVSIEKDGQV